MIINLSEFADVKTEEDAHGLHRKENRNNPGKGHKN